MTDYSQSISLPGYIVFMQSKRFQSLLDEMSESGFAGKGEYSEKEYPDTDQSSGLLTIVVGISADHHSQLSANFSSSLENIQQVSDLGTSGIYYQISTTFNKLVNISLTMANDSLLHDVLIQEKRAHG